MSEYELITKLREELTFLEKSENSPWQLFHIHFLVFHSLYQLQTALASEKSANLQISPLQISLHDARATNQQALAEKDAVREFYLDLDNMLQTSEEDVYSMLADFWNTMGRREGRDQALEVLGLSDPVDDQQIRQRYRELVMQHHPDRGGNQALLQDINQALYTLIPRKKISS